VGQGDRGRLRQRVDLEGEAVLPGRVLDIPGFLAGTAQEQVSQEPQPRLASPLQRFRENAPGPLRFPEPVQHPSLPQPGHGAFRVGGDRLVEKPTGLGQPSPPLASPARMLSCFPGGRPVITVREAVMPRVPPSSYAAPAARSRSASRGKRARPSRVKARDSSRQ